MKEALHTAIAYEVAKRLGWTFPEVVGEGAAMPDRLEFVYVDGVGTKFLNNNLACCTHFAGYRLRGDASLGRLNLPDREVLYKVGAWPEVPKHMEVEEPLYQLLKVPGYSHAFDEMTFPSAGSYAGWLERCYRELEVQFRDAGTTLVTAEHSLCLVAGMCLHYVQDMQIPQHRRNEMLHSHAETEAQALRRWETMGEQEKMILVRDCIERSPEWSPRGLCDVAAEQPGPKVSRFSCFRRKVVDQIITRGITCTAAALKRLRPEEE